MTVKQFISVTLTSSTLLLAGCASIVGGAGDQSVRLNSTPPGAKVTIEDKKGKSVCVQTTPAVAILRREHGYLSRERYHVTFDLDGYQRAEEVVKSRLSMWYSANFFFGGLIGMLIVDPATGAMWTLDHRNLDVKLTPCDQQHASTTAGD